MNLIKTGLFIKTLRNEKELTQEQLSEQFNVSRRTVSRWETGTNVPDMDILIEMADYFNVDLRELLDGERKKEKMDKELKETVLKVAEYSNNEKKRVTIIARTYFIIGIVALIANFILTISDLPETFWTGFSKGLSLGLAMAAMVIGLIYTTGHLAKLIAFKKNLLDIK